MSNPAIHPTALVDPKARIGRDVLIGPYCIVGPGVTLGNKVELKAHVVLDGLTTIGESTRIFPFASIGSAPQDLKYKGEPSELVIGKNNTIREHVTMNPGTASGAMKTQVGDNGLFMVGVHIAHDCVIGDNVIMANNATLGGHVQVGNHVLIGGLAAVHQFIRIGDYAVIGGMTGVENDVIPFGRVKGERGYLAGLNLVGLERGGFDKDAVRKITKAVDRLFADDGTFDSRLAQLSGEYEGDRLVETILTFAKGKERFGLCQPLKKAA